jgi:hypothetical protein
MIFIAFLGIAVGCGGEESRAVIRQVSPLNGSTRIDTDLKPEVRVASAASVDPYQRRIVLYDVTGGGQTTVAGNVAVEGSRITYQPGAALQADHDYSLVLEPGSVTGESVDMLDASEDPQEPVTWPYRLRFSTGSRPRVRAAYLQGAGSKSQAVVVRFSQPMNPIVTGKEIQVLDAGGKPMVTGAPVWLDTSGVKVALDGDLDPVGIYTLKVGRAAIGEDGILLDGDDDGTPGGKNDDFAVRFTGSQEVIHSRLQ